MAAQALRIHIFGRGLGGIEDLGRIPAARNVLAARTVAVLAGHAIAAVHQRHLGVRIVGESLGDFVVAAGAGFRAHKLRLYGCLGLSCGRFGPRIRFGRLSSQSTSAQNPCAKHQHQTGSQSRPLARSRIILQLRKRPIPMHEIPPSMTSFSLLEAVVPIFGLCGTSLHSMNAIVILLA